MRILPDSVAFSIGAAAFNEISSKENFPYERINNFAQAYEYPRLRVLIPERVWVFPKSEIQVERGSQPHFTSEKTIASGSNRAYPQLTHLLIVVMSP